MTGLVSIVVPSYNCEAFLAAAIESALGQTYRNIEVIVVDDGSTDATPEIVAPFLQVISYIRQANTGLPGARNTGIRAARGEFIAFLDADDTWQPEKLTLQLPLFADPEVGLVYSDLCVRYSDGRFLPSYLAERPLATEGYVADQYIQSRFLFPSTVVVRRSVLDQCGLFDEDMLAAEDMALFTRICLRWKVARIDRPLMVRWEGAHNITADNERMSIYSIKALRRVLEREPALPRTTRRALFQELARQYTWRAYALSRQRKPLIVLTHTLQATRFDWRTIPANLRALAGAMLPTRLLVRWGHSE